jgi:hypothetical protein
MWAKLSDQLALHPNGLVISFRFVGDGANVTANSTREMWKRFWWHQRRGCSELMAAAVEQVSHRRRSVATPSLSAMDLANERRSRKKRNAPSSNRISSMPAMGVHIGIVIVERKGRCEAVRNCRQSRHQFVQHIAVHNSGLWIV